MSLLKDKIELDVELAELKTKQALGRFPRALRWIFIISVAAIIPANLIAKSLSNAYWARAYKQYAITTKPSFTNALEPKISDVFVTTSGDGVYSAGVQVSNQNVDLSLALAPYQFIFLNSKNEQIYQETGQMFLLPNESKYEVVPRFASKDAPASASFTLTTPLRWQKKISIPKINIQTSPVSQFNQFLPPAFVATGSYINNSPYELKQVRLTFLIYDKNNKIVGVSRRDDFTVAPFERRSYQIIWPNIFGDPNSQVKVFAESNPLDPNNLNIPQASSSSASNLDRPSGTNN